MDTAPPSGISPTLTLSGSTNALRTTLRHGQGVRATVLQGNSDGPGSGHVTVQIGDQRIAARSALALEVGDRLELVVSASSRRISLMLTSINGRSPSLTATPLDQAIRRMLPLQTSYPVLFDQLKIAGPPGNTANTSPVVRELTQLLARLPTSDQLSSATGLRSAWLNSGLFLESRLSGRHQVDGETLGGDLKGLLFLLRDVLKKGTVERSVPRAPARDGAHPETEPTAPVLRGTLADLRKTVEGNLARLGLQQLDVARSLEAGTPTWAFELPVREGERFDVLRFEIERRPRQKPEKTDIWALTLSLDLPQTGALKIRLSLVDQRLSATLWAQRETTVSAIRQALPRLETMLGRKGLCADSLACHHGAGPESRLAIHCKAAAHLDLKA